MLSKLLVSNMVLTEQERLEYLELKAKQTAAPQQAATQSGTVVTETILAGSTQATVPKTEPQPNGHDHAEAPAQAKDPKLEYKMENGKLICTNCDTGEVVDKFVKVTTTADIFNSLNNVMHKDQDMLDCPTCRGDFTKVEKAKGHDVQDTWDKNGQIVIRKGKKAGA